nr:hypothetical protein [Tanacetum cinerariifolium]
MSPGACSELFLIYSTPQMSPCASSISIDRHSSAAGKSHVSAGRPTGSAGRPVFAGKPTGSAGKPTGSTGRPVSAGKPTSSAGRPIFGDRLSAPADRSSVPTDRILGKVTASASSERFPRASSVENSDIHDVEQHSETVEETRAYHESLFHNLVAEVEKVNSFSNEKSTISSLQEEKKRLKSDFKIRKDEILDKQIQLENKIKELDNILVKTDEIFLIVNQVDARVQNFKIQFLKEAAKFLRDFKSLAKEADGSLAKQKALELEIKRLFRVVLSQDIMSIVQNPFVVDTSNPQTELEHTKK